MYYNNITPKTVVESFRKKYPNDILNVTVENINHLIKKMITLNNSYSKDLIEHTLHYLVNIQYQHREISMEKMNHLHLLITQRLDEVYDEFKTYPYGSCCLLFLN